jgi:hypothetical protein
MGMLERWTLSLAVLFIQACSSGQPPNPPPPPAKTGFESTVDQGAANTQRAIDAQERGDSSP